MKEIDCQVFQDQLDSLVEGSLSDEGVRQLRLHAAICPECAMSLRVLEHLVSPSLEELEARVPGDLLAGVWGGVEARLEGADSGDANVAPVAKSFGQAGGAKGVDDVPAETSGQRDPRRVGGPPGSRARTWLVPTLAAASVALLLSTGFLSIQLRDAESRGATLQAEIADLQSEMAAPSPRAEWVQRTAQLAGSRRTQARALDLALAGRDNVTVQELLDLLKQLPPDMVVLDASRAGNLLGATVKPPPEIREILMEIAATLSTLDEDRGVRVGDLARWLAASGLPPDLSVPKMALMDLLS